MLLLRSYALVILCILSRLVVVPELARGEQARDELIALTMPTLATKVTKITRKAQTDISFLSGDWHGTKWKHTLLLIPPQKHTQVTPKRKLPVILFIDNFQSGSHPSHSDILKFREIANLTNTPVACLGGIPNEPLFEKKEGHLVAYSIQRYLETGDVTWPILIPMVRAVRTAMAILSHPKITSTQKQSFIVVGSSKRGWATYLTAATDNRVSAFAVLAFDFVRFDSQIAAFHKNGSLSKELMLYDQLGLFTNKPSSHLKHLLTLLDPFSYHRRLDMPKLLMSGTSDRFWDNSMWTRFAPFFQGRTDVVRLPGVGHDVFGSPLGYQTLRDWLIDITA